MCSYMQLQILVVVGVEKIENRNTVSDMLFNAMWAILQLYHGDNNFNIDMISAIY